MSKNFGMIFRQAKKEIERQWKFESSVVSNVNSNGTVDVSTGGRDFPKSNVGNVYPSSLQGGDNVVHLGSTMNDMPMGFGRSPWITG